MTRLNTMDIRDNVLYIGNVSTTDLAKEFKTPLYVIDEELLREKCKRYFSSFKCEDGNRVAYAGKAFLTMGMCQIIESEGLYLDVVSGGELYTAYKSGYPMEKVYFHGNNKTLEEIDLGINLKIGRFVADNLHEIEMINEAAKAKGIVQKIYLRITPGIEAHTHEYIRTGQLDSKFGFALLKSTTISAVRKAIELTNVELVGLHCHIGSQIFDTEPYKEAVNIMFNLLNDIKKDFNYEIRELDLGGGFGIYYNAGDTPKSIEEFCNIILNAAEEKCRELNYSMPILTIEPGRSIVGNAGTTLYTIGAIKEIPSIRKYIAVDGGMTDNIRPALYNADYECVIANRVNSSLKELVTVAGKCCETGDILLNDIELGKVESGDLLAVLSTGAYGYSMSSNYNKIPKPAVVIVNKGNVRVMCKRQTYEDLIREEL